MKDPFHLHTEANTIWELNNAIQAPPPIGSTDFDQFSVEHRSSSALQRLTIMIMGVGYYMEPWPGHFPMDGWFQGNKVAL